jgi:phosphatidylserine/phosphatidylglycerophosphate/cardiolipin synthase-like enzyme
MPETSLLRPGQTVWRTATAERFSFIVDAADFFLHAKQAMLSAQHSVYLIGWDFDARIPLEPEGQTLDGPNRIGKFLNWLAKERPDLKLRVLKWDIGLLRSLGRGETSAFLFYWRIRRRIDLRLDGAHPPSSAHHMKILVVDDSLAFCGGIDMTQGRWDTREHEPGRDGRKFQSRKAMKPWHDTTTCVSGEAAKALGELARDRWLRATDEKVEPAECGHDIWPEGLEPQFRNVEIGIARTIPEYKDAPQVAEIEAATLEIVKSVKRTLYIESQYLASRRIADVMAERLDAPEGPEIVVICPQDSEGWLEPKAMDSARARMIRQLREADRGGRFRIFCPVNSAGAPIYVHAKVMIADDLILKVGSANLNNRSMGFDSECDILLEARTDQDRAQIRSIRDDLIAEHVNSDVETVGRAVTEADGSIVRAIETLNPRNGRRLMPITTEEHSLDEEMLAESDLADPIRPVSTFEAVTSLFRTFAR